MSYKPFYIQDFKTGLEKDKADYQLLPDAFSVLNDAYVWRDRVRKKSGHRVISRLTRVVSTPIAQDDTDGTGTYNDADLLNSVRITEPNATIKAGTIVFTIDAGNPNESIYNDATTDGIMTYVSGTYTIEATGNTINYETGEINLNFTGTPPVLATQVTLSYYPTLPCMGIYIVENQAINEERTVVFDTKYMYEWDGALGFFTALTGATWAGSDSQFFWLYNYRAATPGNIAFITNFNKTGADPIYRYNIVAGTFSTFAPPIDASGNELHQAKIIIPFKDRVLAFNTWEGATLATSTNYPRRVRFSWNGDVLNAEAWWSHVAGRGGYIDAPTAEHIVSVEFVRDLVVVGFEKSHWLLRYTGNEILPFVWEQIDNEFGIESTYSTVRLDKAQVGISANGIVACDGVNVQRIDEKIPDAAFQIENENDAVERVHGIRDYNNKLIYWTYPDAQLDRKFPNKLLVYNYDNNSWAFFRDNITALGYFQQTVDLTWADVADLTWEEAQFIWADASKNAFYPDVIGGNQQGYIFKIQDKGNSDAALSITAITSGTPIVITIPDHNLESTDFIEITGVIGTFSSLNDVIYKVTRIDADTINISEYDDVNKVFVPVSGTATYFGLGEVTLIPDVHIRTKRYNSLETGKSIGIAYLDFLVSVTNSGEFNLDIFEGANATTPVNTDLDFFNNTVETYLIPDFDNPGQDKIIHRSFTNMHSQFIQFEVNLTDAQKVNSDIVNSDIEIYSIIIWGEAKGSLI